MIEIKSISYVPESDTDAAYRMSKLIDILRGNSINTHHDSAEDLSQNPINKPEVSSVGESDE